MTKKQEECLLNSILLGVPSAGAELIPTVDNSLATSKTYSDVASFAIENTGAVDITFTTTNQSADQTVAAGKRLVMESIKGFKYGVLIVDATGSTADVAVLSYS